MSKKSVVPQLTMTIGELRKFIPAVATELSVLIQSEPGCGKTSLLGMIAEDMGDTWRSPSDTTYYPDDKYDYIYVDCPVKDMQDIGMTIPNHEKQSLEYYVASLFKLTGPSAHRPKCILLDELLKAPKLLQVIFTRLELERMVGDIPLPEGSMIISTSNNESDGVGDNTLAHGANRRCKVRMSKPNATTWIPWAKNAGVDRIILSFVSMYPRCLASYLDADQEDNPYIFKPNGPKAFCSPRSLAKSNVIIKNRHKFSENALLAGLAGTIGEAAAKDMSTFIAVEKSVRDAREIISDPSIQPPEEVAAQLMIMFQAVDVIETQSDMSSFMKFVEKIPSNMVQSIFFTMVMRHPKLIKLGSTNERIKEWLKSNYDILT